MRDLLLDKDHPGINDQAYLRRRAALSHVASRYRRGGAVPVAQYVDEEHELWALCHRELATRHERFACQEFLGGADALAVPGDHVPQLDEVSALLFPLTGFRYEPVEGLVSPVDFYAALGDGWFKSTQYIRHHSVPRYTPEPDVIHEVIGHANQLASPRFATVYRDFGAAVQRLRTAEAIQFLSRVFWFTIEFGVVRESRALKAYGAGILSSFGELDAFGNADIRPFDVGVMGRLPYDITRYQPVLFAADSVDDLVGDLGAVLNEFDDDAPRRYQPGGVHHGHR